MVEQEPEMKPEMTDFVKNEMCTVCLDTEKYKSEFLDPDCEEMVVKKENCDHLVNPLFAK